MLFEVAIIEVPTVVACAQAQVSYNERLNMPCLTISFKDEEKIILEFAGGQKIELRHFRSPTTGAKQIRTEEAPPYVKIDREKRTDADNQ